MVTYDGVLRGGPSLKMSEQRADKEKEPRTHGPGIGKSRFKGPEAAWRLTCLGRSHRGRRHKSWLAGRWEQALVKVF